LGSGQLAIDAFHSGGKIADLRIAIMPERTPWVVLLLLSLFNWQEIENKCKCAGSTCKLT